MEVDYKDFEIGVRVEDNDVDRGVIVDIDYERTLLLIKFDNYIREDTIEWKGSKYSNMEGYHAQRFDCIYKILTKKVNISKLSKKLYPDAEEKDGYLYINIG